MNKSPCSSRWCLAAMQRPGDNAIAYIEGIIVYLSAARRGLYPGGRALGCGPGAEARYPAGMLGDIQAVTVTAAAERVPLPLALDGRLSHESPAPDMPKHGQNLPVPVPCPADSEHPGAHSGWPGQSRVTSHCESRRTRRAGWAWALSHSDIRVRVTVLPAVP